MRAAFIFILHVIESTTVYENRSFNWVICHRSMYEQVKDIKVYWMVDQFDFISTFLLHKTVRRIKINFSLSWSPSPQCCNSWPSITFMNTFYTFDHLSVAYCCRTIKIKIKKKYSFFHEPDTFKRNNNKISKMHSMQSKLTFRATKKKNGIETCH